MYYKCRELGSDQWTFLFLNQRRDLESRVSDPPELWKVSAKVFRQLIGQQLNYPSFTHSSIALSYYGSYL